VDESQEKKEAPTIMEQMGGVSGLISSTLPILILIPVNARWGLMPALMAAMGVACGVFLWRIIRRENLQPAFSGLIGVGIGAAIAWFTGDAKGFFLYGIWMSLLYAAIFFISVIIRWPAVGVVWKGINDQRKDVEALIKFCKFAPSKVNLIEYNPIDDGEFQQADSRALTLYQTMLEEAGITVTVRHSRGKDIDAACGQLANKTVNSR